MFVVLLKILQFVGMKYIVMFFSYIKEKCIASKKREKIFSNKFFSFMTEEKEELLPYWVLHHKGRQTLVRVFFPIKVSVFLESMREISKKTVKTKKLDFISEKIYYLVDEYNRKALLEWEKLYSGNKSMEIFCERFSKVHQDNINKTADRIQYILDKDICDLEKIDRILDSLYWAFKLSLNSVLSVIVSINGELTKELSLVIVEPKKKTKKEVKVRFPLQNKILGI